MGPFFHQNRKKIKNVFAHSDLNFQYFWTFFGTRVLALSHTLHTLQKRMHKKDADLLHCKNTVIVPFFKNPKFCLVKSWNFEKILVSARRPQNSGSETALYIPLLLPI